MVHIPPALVPIQHPNTIPGEAVEDGPGFGGSLTTMDTQMEQNEMHVSLHIVS